MDFNPTKDYGLSDLSDQDNLIRWKFCEFIKTLITLSSQAEIQYEIIGAGAITDEMMEDFNTYFILSYKQFLEQKLLDEKVVQKLINLDKFFDIKCENPDSDFWNDDSLPTNSDWKEVRVNASEILKDLKFDHLTVEFDRTEKRGIFKKLLVQTTRTRLVLKKD